MHPELKNVIEKILERTDENKQLKIASEEKQKAKDASLNVERMDFETLEDFYNRYAPLQLIADRKKTTRVRLPRRILSASTLLENASNLMKRVSGVEGDDEKLEALATSLAIDKRSMTPHPM